MPIRKRDVQKFSPDSAEYVVAHADYARTRGRGPSTSFEWVRNPQEAVKVAQEALRVMETIRPLTEEKSLTFCQLSTTCTEKLRPETLVACLCRYAQSGAVIDGRVVTGLVRRLRPHLNPAHLILMYRAAKWGEENHLSQGFPRRAAEYRAVAEYIN